MQPHRISGPVQPAAAARALRLTGAVLGGGALLGGATLAYAAGIEVRSFVVRRVEVPLLPPGHRPIKVLHVSEPQRRQA